MWKRKQKGRKASEWTVQVVQEKVGGGRELRLQPWEQTVDQDRLGRDRTEVAKGQQ